MSAIITNHAMKRIRKRIGLPKKACQRMADTAYDKGSRHSDASGRLKRYFDGLYLMHRNANNLRLYGKFVYLFAGNHLVTVVALPKGLK